MFTSKSRGLTASKGFTLIELLVVIAIIGILSSVVLASLNNARKKGRDARRVSDIKQIQLALELYYDSNGEYPAGTSLASLAPTYIAAVPTDPTNTGTNVYSYQASNAAGTAACATAPCSNYTLKAVFEQDHVALDSDADGAFVATAAGCDDAAFNYCVKP